MADTSTQKSKIWPLLRELYHFTAPKGDNLVRNRLILALTCLVLARLCAACVPLIYGRAVDTVNLTAGFGMGLLMALLGGYALARLGQQTFSELKEFFFARVLARCARCAMAAFTGMYISSP